MYGLRVRVAIGAASLAAFVLAFILDGWWSLVPPIASFLLPLAIHEPIGVPRATADGTRIVTGRSASDTVDRFARIFGVACILAFACLSSFAPSSAWAAYTVAFGSIAFVVSLRGLTMRVLAPGRDAPSATLEREMLLLRRPPRDVEVVPYRRIRSVEVEGSHIVIATDVDRHVIDFGGSSERAAAVACKIIEARDDASRDTEKDETRMDAFHRPSGMSVREWLGRIDALVASSRNAAYRAAAIDEEALWVVLRDDGANVEARAAAARALAASPDQTVRLRVAAAASEIPGEAARVRIAVAMTADVDDAAEQLDALDREELRRAAGV